MRLAQTTRQAQQTRVLRDWLQTVALLAAVCLILLAGHAFAGAREVKGFVLTVSDLDRSVAFFEQALGFRKLGGRTTADRDYDYVTGVFGTRVRTATLRLGDETIELDQYLSPGGKPIPLDSRSNDLWFQHFAVVVSDMDKAYAHVSRFPIQAISSAPQTIPEWNKAAAGVRAFKFRDFDGHPLELLYLPPDKGPAKWQRKDALFLGIDHSAITVSNTERSFGFYRDLLGLNPVGGSLNSGETQEQLDNAFGAVVRVTGLRPQSTNGPGLEFLQYLTPGGGRSAPVDTRANDLMVTRTVIEVDDLDDLATKLQQANVSFISPRVVNVTGQPYGRQLMVKDPDGHAVLLVQP
jgi:catechol 2,3-dioxygenase-like lactoylglutathione lyase family enzyme